MPWSNNLENKDFSPSRDWDRKTILAVAEGWRTLPLQPAHCHIDALQAFDTGYWPNHHFQVLNLVHICLWWCVVQTINCQCQIKPGKFLSKKQKCHKKKNFRQKSKSVVKITTFSKKIRKIWGKKKIIYLWRINLAKPHGRCWLRLPLVVLIN